MSVHNILMSHALLNVALIGAGAVVLSPFAALAVLLIRRSRSRRAFNRVAEF
jgi:hypothetical protein